jgi:hypothetical protein
MQKIAWSWSRLEKFEQCPKLFHGLNISKEIAMDNNNPVFVRGREAHSALDVSMQNLLRDQPADLPESVYPDNPVKLAHVEPLIQRLHDSSNYDTIYTEQQLAFTTEMERVGWFSRHPPVWLRVGLDLIAIDTEKRHAFVIDWKTGKKRHVEWGRGQLALFAIAAFAVYEVDTITTCYIWIEHGEKTVQNYKRDEYEGLLHEFGERSELIQLCNQSGNWEAKKNNRCKWCPAPFGWCQYKI